MRKLRFVAATVLLLGSAAIPDRLVWAQETPSPEALQAASDLFTLISGDLVNQLMAQLANAFWPQIEQKMRANKVDDATIAELRDEFQRIEVDFVREALKGAPAIYARHFTVSELRELAAFYRSPTGAKALHEMPQVMGEFTVQMMPKLNELQGTITEAFNRILRKHGYLK